MWNFTTAAAQLAFHPLPMCREGMEAQSEFCIEVQEISEYTWKGLQLTWL